MNFVGVVILNLMVTVLLILSTVQAQTIMNKNKDFQFVFVVDNSRSDFDKHMSYLRSFANSLYADQGFKNRPRIKVVPYSYHLKGELVPKVIAEGYREKNHILTAIKACEENLAQEYTYEDGLRSLARLLFWEKEGKRGAYQPNPPNLVVIFIGGVDSYGGGYSTQGAASRVNSLINDRPISSESMMLFFNTKYEGLIPVLQLNILSAARWLAGDDEIDWSYSLEIVLQDKEQLERNVSELKKLLLDPEYLAGIEKAYQEELARRKREGEYENLTQIEDMARTRFRLENNIADSRPQYRELPQSRTLELPLTLESALKFPWTYRLMEAEGHFSLVMRRHNYILDYEVLGVLGDEVIRLLLNGKNFRDISEQMERQRAAQDIVAIEKIFSKLPIKASAVQPIEGTEAFRIRVDFAEGVQPHAIREALKEFNASPKSSTHGHGYVDEIELVSSLYSAEADPSKFISRRGNEQITVDLLDDRLNIPKTLVHPGQFGFLYDIRKNKKSEWELVLRYRQPVLSEFATKRLGESWLKQRTNLTWSQIKAIYERERMLGRIDRPQDGELDFFVSLFQNNAVPVLSTEVFPKERVMVLRFEGSFAKEHLMGLVYSLTRSEPYRDISAIADLASRLKVNRQIIEQNRIRLEGSLSPEMRQEIENTNAKLRVENNQILSQLRLRLNSHFPG